jgi:hypothetical protein
MLRKGRHLAKQVDVAVVQIWAGWFGSSANTPPSFKKVQTQ